MVLFFVVNFVIIRVVEVCKFVDMIGVLERKGIFWIKVVLFLSLMLVFICCNFVMCWRWFLNMVFVIMLLFLFIVNRVMNWVCILVGKLG